MGRNKEIWENCTNKCMYEKANKLNKKQTKQSNKQHWPRFYEGSYVGNKVMTKQNKTTLKKTGSKK